MTTRPVPQARPFGSVPLSAESPPYITRATLATPAQCRCCDRPIALGEQVWMRPYVASVSHLGCYFFRSDEGEEAGYHQTTDCPDCSAPVMVRRATNANVRPHPPPHPVRCFACRLSGVEAAERGGTR